MEFNKFSSVKPKEEISEEYIDINDENVLIEFTFEDNDYCVLGGFSNDDELIYFGKIELDEYGDEIIKRVDESEYDKVVNHYEELIKKMEDSYE